MFGVGFRLLFYDSDNPSKKWMKLVSLTTVLHGQLIFACALKRTSSGPPTENLCWQDVVLNSIDYLETWLFYSGILPCSMAGRAFWIGAVWALSAQLWVEGFLCLSKLQGFI